MRCRTSRPRSSIALGLSTDDTWDEIDDPVLIGPRRAADRDLARGLPVRRADDAAGVRGHQAAAADRAAEGRRRGSSETGQKLVILFEGRDAAGKGGTIKRFIEHLNPRGASVVALTRAERPRAGPVVLPAVRAAPADARRDRPVRPLLVQPRRRRAGDGVLHRRRVRGVPPRGARVRGDARRARAPRSSSCGSRCRGGSRSPDS